MSKREPNFVMDIMQLPPEMMRQNVDQRELNAAAAGMTAVIYDNEEKGFFPVAISHGGYKGSLVFLLSARAPKRPSTAGGLPLLG